MKLCPASPLPQGRGDALMLLHEVIPHNDENIAAPGSVPEPFPTEKARPSLFVRDQEG